MIHWLTTKANPRRPATGYDAGQTGWMLHAVEVPDGVDSFDAISRMEAICGLYPRYGWSLDLFIDQKCAKCLKKTEPPK